MYQSRRDSLLQKITVGLFLVAVVAVYQSRGDSLLQKIRNSVISDLPRTKQAMLCTGTMFARSESRGEHVLMGYSSCSKKPFTLHTFKTFNKQKISLFDTALSLISLLKYL